MIDLMELYDFCGHPVDGLDHLEGRLKTLREERETDCKALGMVLAAAKELHSPQVRGMGQGCKAACRGTLC
jgi:hypothetical protein